MHSTKIYSSNIFTEEGIEAFFSEVQSINACLWIIVTELGISIFWSEVQNLKAHSSIVFKDEGVSNIILLIHVQQPKEAWPIVTTEDWMTNSFNNYWKSNVKTPSDAILYQKYMPRISSDMKL